MIDALRYEFVRLRTIRSTYWLVGLALLFQLVMSMVIAWRLSLSTRAPRGDGAFDILATIGASTGFAPLFIAYIIGLLGVFSTGHEYRHGMIRATLTALPERRKVFLAKVISTALVSALAALACVLVALMGLLIFGLDMPSLEELLSMGAGTVVFTVLFSLSGLAYAALTRNQTAAVALLMLVPTVVEQIIRAIVIASSPLPMIHKPKEGSSAFSNTSPMTLAARCTRARLWTTCWRSLATRRSDRSAVGSCGVCS